MANFQCTSNGAPVLGFTDPSFPYQGIEADGVGFSILALNDITQTIAIGKSARQ